MITELTLLLAKLYALGFVAVGLAGIVNKNIYQKWMADIQKNSGVTLLFGFFALLVGFLIVMYHNFWQGDWGILITIFGWIGFIKGITLIILPKRLYGFSKPMFKGKCLQYMPYLVLILGLVVGYLGFFL